MKIVVLMSTYNGDRFLEEQIDSILAQDIKENAQMQLIVRDDGSKDDTTHILDAYQNEQKLTWYASENLGPEKSFWDLLKNAPDADYYAFCDQDDVWFPDKLSRAILRLSGEPQDKPLLYCSGFTATDGQLQPLVMHQSPLHRYTDYAHALVYSTAPGCTFVLNRATKCLASRYDMDSDYVVMHDWLIHKIVTVMGGIMVYDATPSMYYRQHGSNLIGVKSSGFKDFLQRIHRFWVGTGRQTRSECAKSLLHVYGEDVSRQAYSALDLVANYRGNIGKKIAFMRDRRFRTGTINDLFLAALILLERV